MLSLIVSVVALLATFYQLYLQRVHNEKSLKPLGQIDLLDHQQQVAVHIRNNGLGPLLIDRITFSKAGHQHTDIAACLDLAPRAYRRTSVDAQRGRVILPNSYLDIFGATLESNEPEANLAQIRHQLAPLTVTVYGRDIYNNKVVLQRSLDWFVRHLHQTEPNVEASPLGH